MIGWSITAILFVNVRVDLWFIEKKAGLIFLTMVETIGHIVSKQDMLGV